MEGVMLDRTILRLDTTGKVCPYPALETIQVLKGLPPGGILELITNNEATVKSSVPVICKNFGATFSVEKEGDSWRILIQKA
jgi:TusA-related sulfurtransferase